MDVPSFDSLNFVDRHINHAGVILFLALAVIATAARAIARAGYDAIRQSVEPDHTKGGCL